MASLFFKPGQNTPEYNEMQAIGISAGGLRKVMDYLETDRYIDAFKIAVIGHSRLRKTALWVAAQESMNQ